MASSRHPARDGANLHVLFLACSSSVSFCSASWEQCTLYFSVRQRERERESKLHAKHTHVTLCAEFRRKGPEERERERDGGGRKWSTIDYKHQRHHHSIPEEGIPQLAAPRVGRREDCRCIERTPLLLVLFSESSIVCGDTREWEVSIVCVR